MTKGDDLRPFTPFDVTKDESEKSETKRFELDFADKALLQPWVNPTYLEPASMKTINKSFCKDSSIQVGEYSIL